MSLDVDLMVIQPTSVYSANITHNLGKMASEVKLSNGNTLYEILWRPDEHGFKTGEDIAELLDEGFNILLASPEEYKPYNPENGWGSYEGLVNFVREYHSACLDNPNAELRVSR